MYVLYVCKRIRAKQLAYYELPRTCQHYSLIRISKYNLGINYPRQTTPKKISHTLDNIKNIRNTVGLDLVADRTVWKHPVARQLSLKLEMFWEDNFTS